MKRLNLNKVFDLKHKLELLIAFGTGTVVGFSAGFASRVLSKLLEKDGTVVDSTEKAGLSQNKAEELKEELENTPAVPV
ncbi:hypothetical protein GC174_15750 [bacterium]|nr:hypothetical protein [bacterium]